MVERMVNPILKWAGGKRQLLDELKSCLPADFDPLTDPYHEPFLGGGALFFELEPHRGTINDTNQRLVNFYRQVATNPDGLIERCLEFRNPDCDADPDAPFSDTDRFGKEIEDYYYQQRAIFNNRPAGDPVDELEEAALLLYLNRTGFNGMYRENADGFFNIPKGRYSNPDWIRRKQVKAAKEILDRVEIKNEDYSYITEVAEPGDVVYFDPPYKPMSRTADFTQYSAEGFDEQDQRKLLQIADNLAEEGVHVILSNSGVMYDVYAQESSYLDPQTVGAKRHINSDGDNRGEVEEIIATSVSKEDRRGSDRQGSEQVDLGQYSE